MLEVIDKTLSKFLGHVHSYDGRTSFNFGHIHQYKGVTSRNRGGLDGHTHFLGGKTSFNNGHLHFYQVVTGPGLPARPGFHVHRYYGITSTNGAGPHTHRYLGVTVPAKND